MVLNDKLRGDWGTEAQREGCGAIQLFIREDAYRGGGFATILAQEFERYRLRDVSVLAGMFRVQVCDKFPSDVCNGFATGGGLGKLNFDRVDDGDMVNNDANRAAA